MSQLTKAKLEGKLSRYQRAVQIMMEENRDSYEFFVRLHRLLFDIDPDTSEVPNEWDTIDEE